MLQFLGPGPTGSPTSPCHPGEDVGVAWLGIGVGCIALMLSLLSVVCRLMRRDCRDPVPVTVVSGKRRTFLPFLPWGMPWACQHGSEDGEGPAAPAWGWPVWGSGDGDLTSAPGSLGQVPLLSEDRRLLVTVLVWCFFQPQLLGCCHVPWGFSCPAQSCQSLWKQAVVGGVPGAGWGCVLPRSTLKGCGQGRDAALLTGSVVQPECGTEREWGSRSCTGDGGMWGSTGDELGSPWLVELEGPAGGMQE